MVALLVLLVNVFHCTRVARYIAFKAPLAAQGLVEERVGTGGDTIHGVVCSHTPTAGCELVVPHVVHGRCSLHEHMTPLALPCWTLVRKAGKYVDMRLYLEMMALKLWRVKPSESSKL